jgi:hypothetical protein
MVSKKLKEELKKFRDKLEKLDSNQDKIVFLRNFVINKKNNERLREEAVKLLNILVKDASLEGLVSKRGELSLKDIEPVQGVEQRVIEVPVSSRRKVEDEDEPGHVDYSVGGGPGKFYSESENVTLKHLREFLRSKGVMGSSTTSLPELKGQISDYFGGRIADSRLESYTSLFSADEVGYQMLSTSEKDKDDENTFNLEGKEQKYYKAGDS